MPKYGSSSAWIRAGGYILTAMKLESVRLKTESIMEGHTGIGDAYQGSIPTGLTKLEFEQNGGFFDTTTDSSHTALGTVATSPQGTARVVCLGLVTEAVGSAFVGIQGLFQITYEVMAQLEKLTKASAKYVAAGVAEWGQVVQPLATKSADWNTKSLGTTVDYTTDVTQRVIPITSATKANPCVVTTTVPHGLTTGQKVLISGNTLSGPAINSDLAVTVISTTTFSVAVNTSASSGAGTGGTFVRSDSPNGAAGYQQITAFSGFTGFVGKLRDSPDDTTYADLITFTNVTSGPTAERVTVTGTVDRYLSYDGNVTGTGSITAFSGLARL